MDRSPRRSRPVRTRTALVPLGSLVVVDGEVVRVGALTSDVECVALVEAGR